jgi:hypothetical protein
MKKLRTLLAREDGIALATVMAMMVIMTALAVALMSQVTDETTRSGAAVTSDAIFQAAEAGINDYIAKLTDDVLYYDHCVAKGESTRMRADTHALVGHAVATSSCDPGGASAWPAGVRWTYPNHKDWWYAGTGSGGSNSTTLRGYAYNLEVTPPYTPVGAQPGADYIDVVSTGCKVVNPDATPLQCDSRFAKRAIEVHLVRTTPADFQYMMTNMTSSDPCWASTIYGRMYSTGDIQVCGATFYGNVMAEGLVRVRSGYPNPPNVVYPGRIYDQNHPDIRTVLKNPLSFNDLLGAVSLIQNNAKENTNLRGQASSANDIGTAFDDSTASAWRINFTSDGKVQVWKCVNSTLPEANIPYCNDVKLTNSPSVKLYSGTSATVTVDQSVTSFPGSASSSSPIYIAPNGSSSPTVALTYSGKGSDGKSFTGVKCSSCGSSGVTFNAGQSISLYKNGLTGPVPAYNGKIPDNGAIYTGQDAIISWPAAIPGISESDKWGTPTAKVNGRVSIASGGDIDIAGNIHYASEVAPNGAGGADDDVLGLIAQGNIWMTKYAPNDLWWRAATMAVDGLWGDYACDHGPDRGSNSHLTFVGTSTYGNNDGCINGSGGYGYRNSQTGALMNVYRITDDGTAPSCPSDTAPDCKSFDALKWLVPPWFPPLNGMETVLYHEVPSNYEPPAAPAP